MKKYRVITFLIFLLFAAFAPSCKTKSGCEANESLKPQMSKKGEFKTGKKRSEGLFPKKMTKKAKQ